MASMKPIIDDAVATIPRNRPFDVELTMGTLALQLAAWVLFGDRLSHTQAEELAAHQRDVVTSVGRRLGQAPQHCPVTVGRPARDTAADTPAVWGCPSTQGAKRHVGRASPRPGGSGDRVPPGHKSRSKAMDRPVAIQPGSSPHHIPLDATMLAFGLCPRGCIGQHLARAEMLPVLPVLAAAGDFSLDPAQQSNPARTTCKHGRARFEPVGIRQVTPSSTVNYLVDSSAWHQVANNLTAARWTALLTSDEVAICDQVQLEIPKITKQPTEWIARRGSL